MSIVPIKFDYSDAHYATAVRLSNATYPDYPDSVSDWKRGDKNRQPQYLHEHILYQDDVGKIIAYGSWGHTHWAHHPQRFYFDIFLDPEELNKGYEELIYTELMARIQPHNPISIESECRENMIDRVRFLEKHGYTVKTVENTSKLDLDTFDPQPYQSLLKKVADSGIVFRPIHELLAEDSEFYKKYYEAMVTIHKDVPWHEESTYDPIELSEKKFHESYYKRVKGGNLVALDGDEYIGMTMLFIVEENDEQLQTGLTGVKRDYRRKGIATAIKVASLSWAKENLQAASGKAPSVVTENEVNNPMYAINVKLGFVQQPSFLFFVKKIEK